MDLLTDVLLYHVSPRKLDVGDVLRIAYRRQKVDTLLGVQDQPGAHPDRSGLTSRYATVARHLYMSGHRRTSGPCEVVRAV